MENKTSKFAVASIVLGILTLFLFPTILFAIPTGILAIIFGVIAKREDHGSNQSNKGLGIGGIVTGAVGLFITFVFGVFFLLVIIMGFSGRNNCYQQRPYDFGYGHNDIYDYFEEFEGGEIEDFSEFFPEIEH